MLLERTVENLQSSTTTLLSNLQVPLDSEPVQSLMSKFENAKTMFKDVDTFHNEQILFREIWSCEAKRSISWSQADTGRKCGQVKQVLAADACQYISIIETITF